MEYFRGGAGLLEPADHAAMAGLVSFRFPKALLGAECGKECGSRHDEAHVAVPAVPGAGLAMIV
jgi:hypothetical protein